MKKVLTLLDIFSLTGLLIYTIAMLLGILRFGREMGDLGYYFILVLGTIVVLILFFLRYKGFLKNGAVIVSLLALGLLFFIIYRSSLGRGPDFPWNGRFFDY